MALLSIVLPAYNEEENIPEAVKVLGGLLEEQLPDMDYELIFADDGSKDGTFQKIREAQQQNPRVKGISFSRNFGKEAAIFAGLEVAAGDAVVVMDCDLQHPPSVIPEMVEKWKAGAEVVEGIKASRGKESLGYKMSAGLFYKIMSALIRIDMNASSDYKLLDRKVVNVLLELPEHNTFFRALSFWAGFRRDTVSYEVQERAHGSSKWSLGGLVRYAIRNASSFSTLPLQLVTWIGWISILFSIILAITTLVDYFSGEAVEGFTTVNLLILIIGGFIMISLGILGHYLARIYEEVKGRPRYIISEVTGNVSERLCGVWRVRKSNRKED
jgi:dolichol-phosphate mannosyltransferase